MTLIYEFPKTLTAIAFFELSECWKRSSYGKSKYALQTEVRSIFQDQKIIDYFEFSSKEKHKSVEDKNVNDKLNSVFDAVQRWGGKTGMRHKNRWANTSKIPYLRYMINAFNCKSLREIPSIAINLKSDISGLGLSFATKHLKFATDLAVVYDSKIVSVTGLKNSKEGYEAFLMACERKSQELSTLKCITLQEVEEAFFQSTL